MLNQKFKFRGLARAIFFLPVILSSGVVVGIETSNSLLNNMKGIMAEYSNVGRITDVLEELLLGSIVRFGAVRFILDAVNGVYDVIMACGIQILIFLAGLQSVPASMYEAAKIEGATAWESFWKITLPLVSSLILVAVVYSVIDTCIKTDSSLFSKIRNTMIGGMNYGLSASMAWLYFLAIMGIVLVVVAVLSKVVFYDE
jgi:ABC-type sugar transport system permease subunit